MRGLVSGWIKYVYCALNFCYYTVIRHEAIMRLTTVGISGSPELVSLQLDGPPGADGSQWHPKCAAHVQSPLWCCFGCCPCRKLCFTKTGWWKYKQGFQGFCGNLRIFCLDFDLERVKIWRWLKPTCKATIICDLKQLILFYHGQNWFTRHPFLPSPGVFCGKGAMLKLFWKLRQVITHPVGRKKALAQSFSKSL